MTGAVESFEMTQAIVPKELLTATLGGLSLLVVSGGADGQVLTQQADGTYAPEAAAGGSPGGSSGQVQYNNAGAFGGMAAVVYAGTGTHVVITAQSATIVPLCVKGAVSQSANIIEAKNSAGTKLWYVTPGGAIVAAGVAWTGKTYYQEGFSSVGWGLSSGNWYFGNGHGDWKFGLHNSIGVQIFSGTLGFNANSPGSSSDTGVSRNAAGVIEINNGTVGTFRDLIVRNLRLSAPTLVPASASATGSQGQIAWDTSYIYVCTATNTWKRVAIATW